MDTQPKLSFQQVVERNTKNFVEITARTVQALLGKRSSHSDVKYVEAGLFTNQSIFISILFTGTIYGEYILSMDNKTAAKLLGKTEKAMREETVERFQGDVAETFCELLNIVVGESIVGLNQHFKKLTITVPRVYFGQLNYPRIKMGKATIAVEDAGNLQCYLFVDRMKLDIAASYQDVLSSLQHANQELQAAMEKLRSQQQVLIQSEKMAALGTMAAGVAHEINTPLATATIVGGQMKDMVQEDDLNKTTLIEMLDTIERTLVRIGKITSGLRTFAHGVRGEPLAPRSTREIIDDTLIFCEHHIHSRGVKLTRKEGAEELLIHCRLPEISQVLVNLINNACDAVQSLPEKWILIETNDLGNSVEIRVTDSGSGIPVNIQSKIFDPFFTTKEVGSGTGLGLSISKGIIDDHKGILRIDPSSMNTCFVVELPKFRKKAAA